jgi:hypothetical protein
MGKIPKEAGSHISFQGSMGLSAILAPITHIPAHAKPINTRTIPPTILNIVPIIFPPNLSYFQNYATLIDLLIAPSTTGLVIFPISLATILQEGGQMIAIKPSVKSKALFFLQF